jgi:hypothetical protein
VIGPFHSLFTFEIPIRSINLDEVNTENSGKNIQMKLLLSSILITVFATQVWSQPVNDRGTYYSEGIENIEIGWTDIRKPKPLDPFIQNGWKYPKEQMDFRERIIGWWQSTYKPKGLMGEMIAYLYAPPPPLPMSNSSYDHNEAAKDISRGFPNNYGAYARLHNNVSKTSTRKFWPTSGNLSYNTWSIIANNIPLINYAQVAISSPDEYYGVEPTRYDQEKKGDYGADFFETYAQYCNFLNSPNLKNYDHYFDPVARKYVVIMTKDRKPLPFEKVTVGELLDRVEKQFETMFKLASSFNDKYPATKLGNAKKGLQIIKERLKEKRKEFVYLSPSAKLDFWWLANTDEKSNISDMIKTKPAEPRLGGGDDYVYEPLVRLKKGVKEASLNSGPLWIIFSIGVPTKVEYGGSKDAMDNFVNRFNYDYVYQYYFGDKKPTEPYKAISPSTSER